MVWKVELDGSLVYGLCDGSVERDPLVYLAGSTEDDWKANPDAVTAAGLIENSFTCYLFRSAEHLVMIDTGFGANAPAGMNAGAMPDELATLGFDPGDIDHVVFTHLHPDHALGALDAGGEPFFPNAVHWTVQREVAHWRSTDDQRAEKVLPVVEALESAGALNATEEPTSVVPGVDRIPTYGHSPGHTSVRLSTGSAQVTVTGDLTWSPVHLLRPEWTSPFDGDPVQAAETRASFLSEMTESGAPFLAGHHPQPGYGRLVEDVNGVRYEPLGVTDV